MRKENEKSPSRVVRLQRGKSIAMAILPSATEAGGKGSAGLGDWTGLSIMRGTCTDSADSWQVREEVEGSRRQGGIRMPKPGRLGGSVG